VLTRVSSAGRPAARAAEKPAGISRAAATLLSSTAFSASSRLIASVFTTPDLASALTSCVAGAPESAL